MTRKGAKWRNWGDHPVVTVVALAAGIASIVATGLLNFRLSAPAPRNEPPGYGPPSANSLNRRMDDELQQAWRELKEGRIAYEPSRTMTEGGPETVLVRIAEGKTIDTKSNFVDRVWVDRLRVSGSMSANLQANAKDFDVVSLSSENQALIGTSTDWVWQVTPLRAGELPLSVRVTARIRLSDGSLENHDILVKRAQISVRANPRWRLLRFWERNWQWLLGSPIIVGILGWLGARLLKRRRTRRHAGF